MTYLVIQNRRTKRLVSGTDFRYWPRHQIYADEYRPPLLLPVDPKIHSSELQRRGINLERFRLVEIEVKERAPCGKVDTHTREG